MAYIEVSDLISGLSVKELAQLTGDLSEEETEGDAELEAVATWCIDSASSLIDAYIASQVLVPLDPAPAHIKNFALNLSKYYLFQRRHNIPDAVSEEYDRIMKFLDKMAQGVIPIVPTDAARDTVQYGGDGRLFNEIVGV